MLHTCIERFDVMDERGNILGWDGEVNKIIAKHSSSRAYLFHPFVGLAQ
jgi:hypothetical protein